MNSSVSNETFSDDDVCDACGNKYKNHGEYKHVFVKPGSLTCKVCGIKMQNHMYLLHKFEPL
jgi:hypothetical protein